MIRKTVTRLNTKCGMLTTLYRFGYVFLVSARHALRLNESAIFIFTSAVTINSWHISLSLSNYFSHCDLVLMQNSTASQRFSIYKWSWYKHTHILIRMHKNPFTTWSALMEPASFDATDTFRDNDFLTSSSSSLNKWVCMQLIRSASFHSHEKTCVRYFSTENANCAHFYRLDTGFQLLWTNIISMSCCVRTLPYSQTNFQKVLTLMRERKRVLTLFVFFFLFFEVPKRNPFLNGLIKTNINFNHFYSSCGQWIDFELLAHFVQIL